MIMQRSGRPRRNQLLGTQVILVGASCPNYQPIPKLSAHLRHQLLEGLSVHSRCPRRPAPHATTNVSVSKHRECLVGRDREAAEMKGKAE